MAVLSVFSASVGRMLVVQVVVEMWLEREGGISKVARSSVEETGRIV